MSSVIVVILQVGCVSQLNPTENHRDGRPARLRQTRGGRYGWPDDLLHHDGGHDLEITFDDLPALTLSVDSTKSELIINRRIALVV